MEIKCYNDIICTKRLKKMYKRTWTRISKPKNNQELVLRIMLTWLRSWGRTSPQISYVSYCSSVSYHCVSKGCVTATLPSAACFSELQAHPERAGDRAQHVQPSAGWFTSMEENVIWWNELLITCSFHFYFSLSSFKVGKILYTVWPHISSIHIMLFQLFIKAVGCEIFKPKTF